MISESSTDKVVIALDAMGGDHAPTEVIKGADLLLEDPSYNIYFKIYGDKDKITPLLNKLPRLANRSELIHTTQIVAPGEKPSNAIRNFKESSMQLAINAVKEKQADAVLSAGNTGALMAMSTITLRTLPQIHRPAIINTLPATDHKKIVLLDLGANIESDANNLFQFAIMGEAFARVVLNKKEPVIALLNIGSEELKGKDSIKLAYSMLKETTLPINFYGYIEGHELSDGKVDVVVTDGFTGNVMLKTIEGYAKVYKHLAKQAFRGSLLAKLQFLFARSAFKKISSNLDARKYNGAMLIGLNGIVVKSHGSTDKVGMCNALKVTYNLARAEINKQIAEELVLTNHSEELIT